MHVKLIEWASRSRGGQMGDFWTVVATPSIAGVPSVPTDAGWSTGKKVGAVVIVAGVVGAIIYAARK